MEIILALFVGLSIGLFTGYFFNRDRERDLLDRLTPDYLMMRNFSESNRQASKKWEWPTLPSFLTKKKVVDIPVPKSNETNPEADKLATEAREEYRAILNQLHEQGVPQA